MPSANDNNIGRAHGIALVAFSFLFVSTLSTTAAGFQGLLPVLEKEKVFFDLCDGDTTTTTTSIATTCSKQIKQLELMFTIAMAMNNIWGSVGSFMLHWLGLRWTGTIGALLYAGGCVAFAFSSNSVNLYIFGYVLIGVGGITVLMTLLHIPNIFLQWRGTLMTMILCGEDSSASVFLLFQIWNSATNVSIKTMFLVLGALGLLYLLFMWTLQPKIQFTSPPEHDPKEFFVVRTLPLRQQLVSAEFISLISWLCIGSMSTYFYMATLTDQLLWISHDDVAFKDRAQMIFSFILPFVGVAATPFFGAVLDRAGSTIGILITASLLVVYAVFSVLPIPAVQYGTFVIFTIARGIMFSLACHLANTMFGINFVVIMGLVVTLAGICVFLNVFWQQLVHHVFDGNFRYMNLGFSIFVIITSVILYIVVKKKVIQPKNEIAKSLLVNDLP